MPPADSRTLVGVDLGGSGFRVRRLRMLSREPLALETDDEGEATEQRWSDGWLEGGRDARRAAEVGAARCRAVGAAVRATLERAGSRAAQVAVAAPGRKTEDGRGIEYAMRFPPVADLARAIARELGGLEVEVAVPLAGDGVAAARGEQVEPGGALRGVERGYYVGGGSGVSEALVVGGEVLPLHQVGRGLCPIDFDPPEPIDAETYIPLEGAFLIPASIFSMVTGERSRGGERRPEPDHARARAAFRAALREGREPALRALDSFARFLTRFADSRARALQELDPGALPALERVVLGQEYGRMFEGDLALLLLDRLPPECCISPLRAAPAIGAVAYALDHEALHGRDAWVRS